MQQRHYIPIPLNYSEKLICHIVNDTATKIILVSNTKAKKKLNKIFNYTKQRLSIINVNDTDLTGKSKLVFKEKPLLNDLAYIMYASGSTGLPKGVPIHHSAIMRLIVNSNFVHINTKDNVAQSSSIAFDAASTVT